MQSNLRLPHVVLPLAVVLVTLVGTAPSQAAAATPVALPPDLVAGLEADRRQARGELQRMRRTLGTAAARQRSAASAHERHRDRARVVEAVLTVLPFEGPTDLVDHLESAGEAIGDEFAASSAALATATERTARAQAATLDTDRRLRALQRASATEDDIDATLGSWRFGSGGPSVSAATIDAFLASKGSPLAGQGAAFLAAGVEHEVDPRFIVAIAGAESYFGITTCAPHNAWGWGCPTSPFSFRSWSHGIDTVTLGLRTGYLDDGLTTVGEVHLRYAPPDASNDPTDLNYGWADNVAGFLREQGGDPQDIEGVLGPSN